MAPFDALDPPASERLACSGRSATRSQPRELRFDPARGWAMPTASRIAATEETAHGGTEQGEEGHEARQPRHGQASPAIGDGDERAAQYAETLKQSFKTAMTTLLEETPQALNNFKARCSRSSAGRGAPTPARPRPRPAPARRRRARARTRDRDSGSPPRGRPNESPPGAFEGSPAGSCLFPWQGQRQVQQCTKPIPVQQLSLIFPYEPAALAARRSPAASSTATPYARAESTRPARPADAPARTRASTPERSGGATRAAATSPWCGRRSSRDELAHRS
jgi:hypothetical protein